MMNVHHLELFYYVARHGGVSAAARHMPYGIQQPAISAQILQLEDALGVTLFMRRPFQLTKEGQSLYEFIAPFFGGLDDMGRRLRGGGENRLRIAAPEIVQREYLPEQIVRMQKRVPGFHFTLTQGRQQEIEAMLLDQAIDLGLGILADKPQPGIQTRDLVKLKLVLLVSKQSRITQASDILERDRMDLPLVTLAAAEGISRVFQAGLRQRGVDWPPSLEVGSLDLIARFVAEGFGVGVSLHLPQVKLPVGVKGIPLPGFPPVAFVTLWSGKLSPLSEIFVQEAEKLAKELFGGEE
jgi:DNA-binding transcriptional LysR family regulator